MCVALSSVEGPVPALDTLDGRGSSPRKPHRAGHNPGRGAGAGAGNGGTARPCTAAGGDTAGPMAPWRRC